MALLRCSKCFHMREVSSVYIGKAVKCPKCKDVSSVYDTVAFVENLLNKYLLQHKEISRLQKNVDNIPDEPYSDDYIELDNVHNTTALSNRKQYEPIVNWFKNKNIQLDVNHDAVDTTGFFDEIALAIGDQYDILEEVINQIKYIQKKGYQTVKLVLAKKSQQEQTVIKKFCKELYEYSFVTKYFFKKQDQVIYLTLQTAPTIINFFNGIWMEWFVLIKLLIFFNEKKIKASCLRSLNVTFSDDTQNELDVFLIANNIPVCFECKSGEFRPYIDKYSKLRKRLKLDKSQFLLCIVGLDEKQTMGLTSTYDLTFVNEKNFLQQLEKTLA